MVVSQGPGTRVMPMIASPAPGVIGFVWYQADCVFGDPGELDVPWNVQFAKVTGADTNAPSVVESRASDRVIHQGGICLEGPVCRAGRDRSLLDFPKASSPPYGAAAVVLYVRVSRRLEELEKE